jgi:hypothetical protein
MGGPPMGGPPMGGPPRPAAVRRGTSKAVPIVVSAGLAVGVFCGLLFGVGKKSEAVAAGPATTEKKDDKDKAAPAGLGASDPVKPTPPAAGSAAGSAVVAAGSAAPTVPPTPPVTVPKTIKLTVTVKPDGAAKDAKLMIDGQAVEGMIAELPADKKSVKIEIKSSGYRSVDKKVDLAGGDTAIEFEMAKRTGGTGTPAVRPPKRPDRPPSGGGGLIDI